VSQFGVGRETEGGEPRASGKTYPFYSTTEPPPRRLVYCTYCHKTHSVTDDEEPCAPGAWLDPDPAQ
jgi:hypothetical protein